MPTFKNRAAVVHPAHGVARVEGHETREVAGSRVRYVILSVAARAGVSSAMRIALPVSRLDEIGVRDLVDAEEADDILALLRARGGHVPSNWARRLKNHQEKLRSGDVYERAEVVRNLARRDRDARLSAAERTMYQRARELLTSELALVWDIGVEQADARVEVALWGESATA